MPGFFAYIRVSTPKQGEHGVSLQEQKDAILRHAERHGLSIARWFEERETAAKRGRPIFSEMVRLLRAGKASGVLIHKIDRSARNLKDWAEIGELIDAGVSVQFVNEALDLASTGGRLAADVQAVVAAHYIRNLREECIKGFLGRLKQGLFPLRAPIGYLDCGGGQPKTIDPKKGPLVRRLFERYATGTVGLHALAEEADRIGLRGHGGSRLSFTSVAKMLRNPFYVGILAIKKRGETFPGVHEPLVPVGLFNRVGEIMDGKRVRGIRRHAYRFRRLFRCKNCDRSLLASRHKSHVYYRCATPSCPTTCQREERLDRAFRDL